MVEVGRTVGARWVVGGAYQRLGERMRITARLVDVRTGAVAAATVVDGAVDDLFALQDRVAADLFAGAGLGAGPEGARPASASGGSSGRRRGARRRDRSSRRGRSGARNPIRLARDPRPDRRASDPRAGCPRRRCGNAPGAIRTHPREAPRRRPRAWPASRPRAPPPDSSTDRRRRSRPTSSAVTSRGTPRSGPSSCPRRIRLGRTARRARLLHGAGHHRLHSAGAGRRRARHREDRGVDPVRRGQHLRCGPRMGLGAAEPMGGQRDAPRHAAAPPERHLRRHPRHLLRPPERGGVLHQSPRRDR